jgi:hypothetical protein
MYLAGVVSGTGVHILVDTGATHNILDINVARLIGLLEQCIDTAILVGSANEVSCRAASFSAPLRIDTEIFYIDAFLLNIDNDIDIILSTPWLAGLGRMTWDFSTMELQYYRNGHPITFTTVLPQCAPPTVLALPAPPPIRSAPREAPPSPPRDIMNRASRSRRPNTLDQFNTTNVVFDHLRRAVLQQ